MGAPDPKMIGNKVCGVGEAAAVRNEIASEIPEPFHWPSVHSKKSDSARTQTIWEFLSPLHCGASAIVAMIVGAMELLVRIADGDSLGVGTFAVSTIADRSESEPETPLHPTVRKLMITGCNVTATERRILGYPLASSTLKGNRRSQGIS